MTRTTGLRLHQTDKLAFEELSKVLEEGQRVHLELVTGRHLLGHLKRFDRFVLVFESEGKEELIFWHAIASMSVQLVQVEATAKLPNYRELIRARNADEADQWGWEWDGSTEGLRPRQTGPER